MSAVAVTTVAVLAPLVATSHSAAAPKPGHSHTVRAVLTMRPGTSIPWQAPGVKVVQTFPRIGAEAVTATPARLAQLRHNHSVLGVAGDWHGHVTGRKNDANTDDAGVLASQVLGGSAGAATTGAGVTVALLDTGVNDTNALNRASGRLVDGVDVSQLSSGGDASTSGTFTDGYGHGTFLASLIAGGPVPGSAGRGLGVAPGARVVAVKVANASGETSLQQVLAAMDWVAVNANRIDVVNLSLALDRPTAPAYGADPLNAAVEHVRDAGVLVVAAVGNTPGQVGDPGMDPAALTVGSVNVDKPRARLSSFSGSGVVDGMVKPDLVAPGEHILGAETHDTVIGRANPSAWDSFGLFRGSGTSEATALVSGAAAAFIADHPRRGPVFVKAALRVTADDMNNWRAGEGLLDLDFEGKHGNGHHGDSNPTGDSSFDSAAWQANSWQNGNWVDWLASSWSASSWSASSWSASSWSASSWSASSWSAGSWSASSWSDAGWGDNG
ncbi:MAG: S8 family serine peptidase [Frankiaceae bacterium]|nr:S8 family serine peptidase [Frankiaceae bacterium]